MYYNSSLKKIGDTYRFICRDLNTAFVGDYDRRSDERGQVHQNKLQASISRTKRLIVEYGLCNDWDLFVTMTISPEKFDRYNLKVFRKSLSSWLRNYNQRYMPEGQSVKYLLIPEMHKDGAWHLHGFLMGLPLSHLSDFVPGVHPQYLIDRGYKNWQAYSKKFGFISVDKIRDKKACVYYMTKYITKDLARCNVELNANLMWHSLGLSKGEYIKKNEFVEVPDYFYFDYVGDWCSIRNISVDNYGEYWHEILFTDDFTSWDFDEMSNTVAIEQIESCSFMDTYGEQLRL